MSDWITVVSSLGGVVVGGGITTALEPIKARFARKDRTRQIRDERCIAFLTAVEDSRFVAVELNAVARARAARQPTPINDQVNEWVDTSNKARTDARKIASLLRMFGPDVLADQARVVLMAIDELYDVIDEVDGGPFVRNERPAKVVAADNAVFRAVEKFALLVRDDRS